MAQEGDSGEKTEKPSARRLSEARRDGQVGVSTDLSNVIGITGSFITLQYVAPQLWEDIKLLVIGAFTSPISRDGLDNELIQEKLIGIITLLAPEMAIIMLIAAFCGAGCTAVQTKFLWSWKLIKPKFSHLNPLQGLKRIFSARNLVNVLKSFLKLCIICPLSYFAFFDLFPMLINLMEVPIAELLPSAAAAASYLFWRIISLLFVLALLDLAWQKWNTHRRLMMSKQEIKEEKKSVEGDEASRRRILSIGLQRARQRMFAAVPTADVVVTNPTHISVALSYSMTPGAAPKVVAKGRGHVALRIREIAKQNGVPIVERKPLARALYKMCEVGNEIPYELFKAVAEILAYVYRIKGKVPKQRSASARPGNPNAGPRR